MTQTDELDRIWREGLERLGFSRVESVDVASSVARALGRRRAQRRIFVMIAATAVLALGTIAVVFSMNSRDSTATLAGRSAPRPVVVDVVDTPGGALALTFPGRVASGQPPHIDLPAGLIEFRIDVRAPGHELGLEGVAAFAPTPIAARGVVTRTVRLAPGVYRLYCAIPGHADAGEQMLFDVR